MTFDILPRFCITENAKTHLHFVYVHKTSKEWRRDHPRALARCERLYWIMFTGSVLWATSYSHFLAKCIVAFPHHDKLRYACQILCVWKELQQTKCIVRLCDMQGDSGGPFACKDQQDSWTLIGVTSFGLRDDSCQETVFARVSLFVGWIQQTIASNPWKRIVNAYDTHFLPWAWMCHSNMHPAFNNILF